MIYPTDSYYIVEAKASENDVYEDFDLRNFEFDFQDGHQHQLKFLTNQEAIDHIKELVSKRGDAKNYHKFRITKVHVRRVYEDIMEFEV
jgi:hypothetical protein